MSCACARIALAALCRSQPSPTPPSFWPAGGFLGSGSHGRNVLLCIHQKSLGALPCLASFCWLHVQSSHHIFLQAVVFKAKECCLNCCSHPDSKRSQANKARNVCAHADMQTRKQPGSLWSEIITFEVPRLSCTLMACHLMTLMHLGDAPLGASGSLAERGCCRDIGHS